MSDNWHPLPGSNNDDNDKELAEALKLLADALPN
jgi:hypothetical protein